MEEETTTSSEQVPLDAAVSAFDRIFNVANRARTELMRSSSNDNLLAATRMLFRRSRNRHSGTAGRRGSLCWNVGLFLLPGPTLTKLPTIEERRKMRESGFGCPVDDTGKEKVSQIQMNWSLADFKQFVCQSFPNVSLNLVGYELAKADRGKNLKKVQVTSVNELKKALGRSRLYILPLAELHQESAPPLCQSRYEPEPGANPETTPTVVTDLTDFINRELSSNADDTAGSTVALQQWRALRHEQDQEFEQSLMADREKEMRRQIVETQEKSRLQILFDFVGQDDLSSEVFYVQDVTSSTPLENSLQGTLYDHKLQGHSTLYVLWTSPVDAHESQGKQNEASTEVNSGEVHFSFSNQSPASPNEPTSFMPMNDCHSPTPPNWSPAHSPAHWSPAPSSAPSTAHWPLVPSPTHWSPVPSPSHTHQWSPEHSLPTQPSSLTTDNCEMISTQVDLQMILKKLHDRVDLQCSPISNQINVSRGNILQGSLQAFKRKRFKPEARLDVIFVDSDGVGEGAVDEGGPTREFLRLLMREIQMSKIFEGPEDNRLLALDNHALENGLYMAIGKMIAVSVVHGGVGPRFFSIRLFKQLCGKCTLPVSLEEIADISFREKLSKIKEADSVEKANSAISDAGDSLNMMGALRYVSSLKERDSLVQSAAEYFVNGRTNLALRQFEEGFQTLGVIEELKNYADILEDLFVNAVRPLEAKDLSTLFEVDLSPLGSNKRLLESKMICFWRDWLIDVEEGDCDPLTLEMVLEFASGASSVPPLGFPHQPKIEFLSSFGQENRKYPEANTCLVILRLPYHRTYDDFKIYMTEGILQSPTFGTM
nr:uncharacterized protein LOC129422116 isoform X2 [Misgurnus anguillicaudatus]